jgi:hypothetical protein
MQYGPEYRLQLAFFENPLPPGPDVRESERESERASDRESERKRRRRRRRRRGGQHDEEGTTRR